MVKKKKMIITSKEEMAEMIGEWEHKNGESFVDYFGHDSINHLIWSGWVIGKGYRTKGNAMVTSMWVQQQRAQRKSLDMEEMFEIYPTYIGQKYMEKNEIKNRMILAEFLIEVDIYREKVIAWFIEQGMEEDEE